ncbi:MAG: hypothetical protein AB1781_11200 [Pseudomonadota bacterium]
MCGGSRPAPPAPTPPPVQQPPAAPPSQRDAEVEGLAERQRRAAAASAGGYDATILTGPLGAAGPAPTKKTSLGA